METINITLKVERSKVIELRRFLDSELTVLEFKVMPDTQKMYEEDETFQMLSKIKKKAKIEVEKYINDNNQKYLNK